MHQPEIDIRKPYTEIGTPDAYSGRSYDERYVAAFVEQHNLPCNPTTAFLTPSLRNIDSTLTKELDIIGNPKTLYKKALEVLYEVDEGHVRAEDSVGGNCAGPIGAVHKVVKDEALSSLMQRLQGARDVPPLSSEGIVTLVEKHLKSPHARHKVGHPTDHQSAPLALTPYFPR